MITRKHLPALALALGLTACTTTRSPDAETPKANHTPATPAEAAPAAPSKDIAFDIAFITHIEADMAEQDVYIEREPGSGQVYRVTTGDNDMNAKLYKTAVPVKHDPFDPKAVGPYPKGDELGLTVGEWLRARGTGKYSYKNGIGTLDLEFTGLVPNGVYTMWHAFVISPPTQPFSGALDAPLGARDGSESVFTADANGNARFKHSFRPGLQLSDTWTTALLAIAYHSDGKTYGGVPGDTGTVTHVPLFTMLPKREGLE
ncbi:MAG: hypothetical protein ACYTGN_06795 [Planctomycetota bacterium]|jgi:hypothetical protein